ncbi:MAG TPA: sigma-70 family RNA polymerase sigma factor [Kofleriaceae bacterium]|nr:sigma-70 family RNA polymerase sigma factor [Kofleriaceae bacterium]
MRAQPVEPTSDADLVARSRRRDAAAFGSLVERHQRLVFGVALARCGDPALAEDVAQDAFVAAWRDLDRLRDAERVGTWVAGIARNLASTAARDRARRGDRPGPEAAGAPSVPTPEDELLGREDRELLARALAEVPAAHREVLVLFYLEGESIARIAASLGIREDLVKQRLSRGRRALRETVARRVETALARARPGHGFSAAVVAAVSALAARKVAAANAVGKAALVMSASQKVVVAVAAVVLVGATWFIARGRDPHVGPAAATAGAAPTATAPTAPRLATPDALPDAPPRVRRLRDAAERQALVEQIRATRQQRTGGSHAPAAPVATTAPGPAPALPAPAIDKAYIRQAVRALLPMLEDCYSQGLERDPRLADTVVVDFTIEGEPGVGGVIGQSAIAPRETTLVDPATRECIQETMYAMEIDPPADGGVVTVHYPFEFHPGEPDR